ncbi:MAG: hypothetical protein QXQ14_00590 [Candidatus Aenigmatarchaeota archaeon]
MNKWKILIALIILEGIWIASLFIPYLGNYGKTEVSNIVYSDLDALTKQDLLTKGYIIAEIYSKDLNIDYNSLINIFDKKVVFIILDYKRNQANIYSAANSKEIRDLNYEKVFEALCNVAINLPPECLK